MRSHTHSHTHTHTVTNTHTHTVTHTRARAGLNTGSCFFSDPKFPNITANTSYWKTDTATGVKFFKPAGKHRKIHTYFAFRDAADNNVEGHGTHTSGTVAGWRLGTPYGKNMSTASGACCVRCGCC